MSSNNSNLFVNAAGENRRDQLFRALADRSRRQIVQALSGGPRSPRELSSSLDDPTRLNYHLRVLREADIVHAVQGRNRRVTYDFVRTSLVEVESFLNETLFLHERAS